METVAKGRENAGLSTWGGSQQPLEYTLTTQVVGGSSSPKTSLATNASRSSQSTGGSGRTSAASSIRLLWRRRDTGGKSKVLRRRSPQRASDTPGKRTWQAPIPARGQPALHGIFQPAQQVARDDVQEETEAWNLQRNALGRVWRIHGGSSGQIRHTGQRNIASPALILHPIRPNTFAVSPQSQLM
eukprot:scaffold462_cov195-Pinguiococcus_pyrenoidosus.AAC.95